MMAKMRHPNTVLFLGFCGDPPVVVTEYCSRGSLHSCLQQVCQAAAAVPAALHKHSASLQRLACKCGGKLASCDGCKCLFLCMIVTP